MGRQPAKRPSHGGRVVRGRVAEVSRDGAEFVVVIVGGERVRARRVLLATGLVDVLPEVPGLAEITARTGSGRLLTEARRLRTVLAAADSG